MLGDTSPAESHSISLYLREDNLGHSEPNNCSCHVSQPNYPQESVPPHDHGDGGLHNHHPTCHHHQQVLYADDSEVSPLDENNYLGAPLITQVQDPHSPTYEEAGVQAGHYLGWRGSRSHSQDHEDQESTTLTSSNTSDGEMTRHLVQKDAARPTSCHSKLLLEEEEEHSDLTGLDNPALDHTETETPTPVPVHPASPPVTESSKEPSSLNQILARIEHTRAQLTCRPLVLAHITAPHPPSTLSPAGQKDFVASERQPCGGHPLLKETPTPSEDGACEASLGPVDTPGESTRDYDDISVTTLLSLHTSTPTRTRSRSRSSRSLGSLRSAKSLRWQPSRRSWVNVAVRGSSLSCPSASLQPHQPQDLSRTPGTVPIHLQHASHACCSSSRVLSDAPRTPL
ncbi:hypothetical protein Pcinc_024150 [Petrolisthes cinctipes]|uniref:Uncharacterized protein n=1 Tax=Petrolisthes cinctipes TaxID=88211 RepID=A0AAE1FDE4_PETCI|nr:hypothetical protein Pcinc_024150 [Petrolisthes cinctipes]